MTKENMTMSNEASTAEFGANRPESGDYAAIYIPLEPTMLIPAGACALGYAHRENLVLHVDDGEGDLTDRLLRTYGELMNPMPTRAVTIMPASRMKLIGHTDGEILVIADHEALESWFSLPNWPVPE